jgi:dihydroneopterin aldolase
MDRILVRDLLVKGILGVAEHERHIPQEILVNLELSVDARAAAAGDDLSLSVSYSEVCERVTAHVAASAPLLVERLASEIAQLLLSEFAVERVRVRVEKTQAVACTRSVGVEIERTAADYDAEP